MKNRLLLASVLLTALTAFASPLLATPAPELIEGTLQRTGEIQVATVGPYVEVGSYRMWVRTHLGEPYKTLADGTWLYRDRSVVDTSVRGTLAIFFQGGRVREMRLLTPAGLAVLTHKSTPSVEMASR